MTAALTLARPSMLRPRLYLAAAAAVLATGLALGLLADPLQPTPALRLAPPSADAPFGRDVLGRDVLSRVVHGGALTLGVAGAGLALTAVVGTAAALVGGYHAERWPGQALGFVGQALVAFPALWLPLVVVALLGNGTGSLLLAVALVALPDYYWVLHREVAVLRAQPFVEAARALGYGTTRILAVELLPHLLPSAVALTLLHVRQAVLVLSTLAFLGLGPPPPTPTWGLMIAEGRAQFPAAWWVVAFPTLALGACVVAAGLLVRRLGADARRGFDTTQGVS
jgi:peptide/nickel transport system permease protein